MACTTNLYDLLPAPKYPNGTWSQTFDCEGGAITNPAAVTINGGYLGTVNFNSVPDGVYKFAYTVMASPGCEPVCQEIDVTVIPGAYAGVGGSFAFCNNDNTDYLLADLLDGVEGNGVDPNIDDDGEWTSGTGNDGYSDEGTPLVPLDDTYNPNGVAPGVYTFIYTVDHSEGDTPGGCTNCVATATLTITISAAPAVGGDGTATVCNAL
jgi:hypothetical protein